MFAALTALTLAAVAMPMAAPPCTGSVAVERTAYVMGTMLRLELRGADRGCALAASEAVLAEVRRLEGVLSSWDSASGVGRLNASAPGTPHALGAELAALLLEARRYAALTDGAFDPGVGALMDAWDMRGRGQVPGTEAIEVARANSGLSRLAMDSVAGTATRPSAAWWLDTGAFGKGAALRAAAGVLSAHGVRDALLDFGGQLLVLGEPRAVAIADARDRRAAMPRSLRFAGASISTTSPSERFVEVAGVRYGHVLDPRTGRPVPAWGSVSVVAADAFAADALSTALYVLGPDAALAWAAAHPGYGVLVQEVRGDDVAVRTSANFDALLLSFTNHEHNLEQ